MATTVMSLRTDKALKEKAHKLAKEMGFPLGTVINAFLRQFIKDKAIHFSMEPTYKMSKYLEKELKEIDKDIKMGKNISPRFENVEESIDYLHRNEH